MPSKQTFRLGPQNDDAISQVEENGTRWPVVDIVMERYLNEEGQ